jgi:ABC-type branched-subunit amino acid transport system substrate-binding protein
MVCLFFACSAPKAGAKKPGDPKPPVKDTSDKVRVYDPESGTYILVPRDAVKVDTVKWTEDKSDPILTDKGTIKDTPDKKSNYEISLLVPLNSDQYTSLDGYLDAKLVRFMQYYGGMRIAADEVQQMGLPVKFRSYDTESSMSQLNSILKDPIVRRSDVIVGPYEKDNLEEVAGFGLENEMFVVSPWLPAFNIETENPYFIQVVPGLNTHAEAIMDFIGTSFTSKKIFLVARNNPTEIQRLALFKNNPKVKFEDLIIDDESIDLSRTNLGFLLDDPDGTVFVMPYYSRSDEDFVNSFMRKLHADKGNKNVIVFGLPQWTGFNNLNSNYMESLSLHISSPDYVNTRHSSYRAFRNKFFQKYFTMPDNQAYQGYDLVMWLATTISKEGPDGLIKGTPSEFGLSSGFGMKPIFREGAKKPSEMKTPLYYENSKVRILRFRDQDFELVR